MSALGSQPALDLVDMVILLSFAAATLTLIVYVWRSSRHRPGHRSTRG